MGRELKRVPLDFDHPIAEPWPGYLSPEMRPCPDCDNGETVDRKWLDGIATLINLLGEAAVSGKIHPWLHDIPFRPSQPPTAAAAEISGGMAGRSPRSPFGHDAIDRWITTKALLNAAGLDEDWGICPTCEGHAIHPDDIGLDDDWEPTEPPVGEGYQLWENTSEGSPNSPVFETLDELCQYAEKNCTVFGSGRSSAAEWKRMLSEDFVRWEMDLPDGKITFI